MPALAALRVCIRLDVPAQWPRDRPCRPDSVCVLGGEAGTRLPPTVARHVSGALHPLVKKKHHKTDATSTATRPVVARCRNP
eukprot:scaffold2090_cov225-Prasinococcus_capsulatus_cf.AAC.3